MNTSRQIKPDLWYVGASDRRLALFENIMPVPDGVSYNSYLLTDTKTVLLDTVDNAVGEAFLENVAAVLRGRPLDYLIIHHVEPDHLAMVQAILHLHPETEIVCGAMAALLMRQFFDFRFENRVHTVKEGDVLDTGRHRFVFLEAKMVHWPEVMVSYECEYKILFSADAFGTFKALSGNLYADEVDFGRDWMDEARRYYTNIVGKYGMQVQKLLQKASGLDIQAICPLHGPIWREDIARFVQKYDLWSRYEPEVQGVLIVYGSMYGHTGSAATAFAGMLADRKGCRTQMYDVSAAHVSYLVAETFKYSHIVLFAPTYNGGLFPPMETYLLDLKAHFFQGHTFAVVENGSWAPAAGKAARQIFAAMKPVRLLEDTLTLKSAAKEGQEEALRALADEILNDF